MIVGVVLLAVLVGATVPVLFQLFSTLRTTRSLLARLGPKIDATLTEVREVSRRLNRVGSSLEQSTKRAQILFETAGDIGESLKGLRDSLRTAVTVSGAVGPALAAAIRALTELRHGEDAQSGPAELDEESKTGEAGHGPDSPNEATEGEKP